MPRNFPADLAKHVYPQLTRRIKHPPPQTVLTKLFEALYFASLKQEENQPISCRVAFVDRKAPDPSPPERIVADRWQCCPLGQDLPVDVRSLVKLSSAVDPWATTLAVDAGSRGELRIWGLIDQSVHYSTFMVKEARSGSQMPGLFQAVIQGIGELAVYDTYTFLGALSQDVIVRKQQKVFQSGPVFAKLMQPIEAFQKRVRERVGESLYRERGHWDKSLADLWLTTLCRILIGIQRYHHGGALLISDSAPGLNAKYSLAYHRLADALFRASVCLIQNTAYSDEIHGTYMDGGIDELPMQLYLDDAVTGNELQETYAEITGCVRFLASLARVDGLIWLDSHLRLQAFGTEITVREDPADPVLASNPQATRTGRLDLNHYGTRHRSMLRYCGANPHSIGFIVSQDGDVRAATHHEGNTVLWDNVQIRIG